MVDRSASTPQDAPVRDAASVVLVRDDEDGPEAFTLTRSATMAFSAGATVFPGGGADSSDELPDESWGEVDITWWAEAFGDREQVMRRLLVTAVRETFEECGVLLAQHSDGSPLQPREYDAARAGLELHELSLADLFAEHGLIADFSLLRPLSRWVTPPGQSRRYDTRFFLAALPTGQQPAHTTGEAVSTRWMSAQLAFDQFRGRQTNLMAPTWSQFRTLSEFCSVEDLLAAEIDPAQVSPSAVPGSEPPRVTFPHQEQYYQDSPDHVA